MLWSLAVAYKTRPDLILGYFICPSALWALFVARLTGAVAGYQMCGGPREITRCGADSENPFLKHVLPGFPALRRLLYSAVNKFDLIIVRGVKAHAFCTANFPSPTVHVITGGVDTHRFQPAISEAPTYTAITVCRLSRGKRVDVFLKAVERTARICNNVRAIVVGDGPERPALLKLVDDLGLSGRVEFTGTQDNVESLLHRSEVFVLSSDDEGMSIALAEAMATGLPAIVSDVGELSQLVQNGANGWLVRAGDTQGFAVALSTLLRDSGLRSRLSAAAARDARLLCGVENVARRWAEVLIALDPDLPDHSRRSV